MPNLNHSSLFLNSTKSNRDNVLSVLNSLPIKVLKRCLKRLLWILWNLFPGDKRGLHDKHIPQERESSVMARLSLEHDQLCPVKQPVPSTKKDSLKTTLQSRTSTVSFRHTLTMTSEWWNLFSSIICTYICAQMLKMSLVFLYMFLFQIWTLTKYFSGFYT